MLLESFLMKCKVPVNMSTYWSAQRMTITVLVSVLTVGCSEEAVVQTEPVVRPTKLIEVTASTGEQQVSFPAIIDASATAELTFEVGGTLNELLVNEGEELQQGDIIARLDPRTYQNDLETAQTQLDSAQAEYARARSLVEENAIARSVFEERRAQRNIARTARDNAQQALDDTELRAPFAGRIASIETEQFQNITPGNPIAILQSIGAAEAVVQIPSSLVANSGNIEPIDTWVELDAAPDERIPAVFLAADTRADASTQTFQAKFGFTPSESLTILPGMTGTVRGTYRVSGDEESKSRVSVPLAAIGADGEQRFAWVVDAESMTVSRRDLVLGRGIGASVPVLDGLEAGETIVGAGMSYLHEGMQIRAYEP